MAFVPGLGRSQITQQLPGFGVLSPRGRPQVEVMGGLLHRRRLAAHHVQRQVLRQPDGAAGVETGHMLAAEQGDDLAEAPAVQVDQALAVAVLLDRHPVKDRRR